MCPMREIAKILLRELSVHVNNFSYHGSLKSTLPLEAERKQIVGKHEQYFVSLTQKKTKRTLSLVLGTAQIELLLELSLLLNESESSRVELGQLWCTHCFIPGAG